MVRGFIGLMGSGKTYAAVHYAFHARKANPHLVVASNIRSLHLPGGECVYIKSMPGDMINLIQQMLEMREALRKQGLPDREVRRRCALLILLDEVNVIMPSRLWDQVPTELLYWLMQTRKLWCDVLYTAQVFDGCDKIVREITAETMEMSSWVNFGFFWYKRYALGMHSKPKGSGVVWARDAVFGAYDTTEMISIPDFGQRRSRSRIS